MKKINDETTRWPSCHSSYLSYQRFDMETRRRGQFYKKIHCLTSEFRVKLQFKNRYRKNRVTFFGIDTCLLYFRDVCLVFLGENRRNVEKIYNSVGKELQDEITVLDRS